MAHGEIGLSFTARRKRSSHRRSSPRSSRGCSLARLHVRPACGEDTRLNGPHYCPRCVLANDLDAISAALAAYLVFEDAADPSIAAMDCAATKGSLRLPATRTLPGRSLRFPASRRQDARSESTASNVLVGSFVEEAGGHHRHLRWRLDVGTALRPIPGMRPAFCGSTTQDPAAWRRADCRHRGTARRSAAKARTSSGEVSQAHMSREQPDPMKS